MLLWLRAASLVGQTVALGSSVFALVVLRRAGEQGPAHAFDRSLALAEAAAFCTALAQAGLIAAQAAALADADGRWPTAALLDSTVGVAGLVRIAIALAVLLAALVVRRAPMSRLRGAFLLASAAALCVTGVLASHAMGRPDNRGWLLLVSAVHQTAVGVWVGGLVCAAMHVMRAGADEDTDWLRPFSAVAAAGVAAVAVTGAALSLAYVATPAAAIGTSYGAMVLTKVALFGALVTMGVLNHHALHRGYGVCPGSWRGSAAGATGATAAGSILVRRRVEVEAGLAIVAILVAASVNTAPPAVDANEQRVTLDEIRSMFTPRWPRLTTPTLTELASASDLTNPDSPRTAEMTAWSEFGHNVAGIFILTLGLLATLERNWRVRWARHWPLLTIVLAGFVAYNLDPEGWQTGAVGFWEQHRSPEVLQHRIMLVLTALFGFAEWRVRSGRHPNSPWRYVFPVAAIWCGVLLLAHTHELGDSKLALSMEISHLVLGLTSLVVGWARWLELRLPAAESDKPGRLWGPALALLGLLLILYHEG